MGSVVAFLTTVIVSLIPIRIPDIVQTCKWILTYLSFLLCKIWKSDRLGFFDVSIKEQPERVGYLTHPVEEELESPHSESHLAKADDGILFYGVNKKGDFAIISLSRLCRRKANAVIHLSLASGKVYELVKQCDFQQSSANKNAFTCGGLQTYYLKPMRTWRIFYSGYLKEQCTENSGLHRMIYVKFSFLWRASSDVYDSTSDLSKAEVIRSVAKEDWENITPPTHKLFKALDFYAQTGVIMGTMSIDEDEAAESQELYLFGGRLRFLGDVLQSKEIEFSHIFGYVPKNGMNLHFGQATMKNIARNINYGFVIKPTGSMKKLQDLDFSAKTDSSTKNTEEMRATIYADRKYMFCGSVLNPTIVAESQEKFISINPIKFFVDGKKGLGICLKGKYSLSPARKQSVVEPPPKIPECVHPMVVAFTEDLCQLSEITGGKGSSLGKLTSLSRELQTTHNATVLKGTSQTCKNLAYYRLGTLPFTIPYAAKRSMLFGDRWRPLVMMLPHFKQNKFTVPPGVVVTTSSYKRFVTPDILNEIKYLEDVLYGNKEGDPKEISKRVYEKIVSTKLPGVVIDNIIKNLQKVIGDDFNSVRFAIRSSATGEDTEQMSAAGQMDTFLGVTGLNNILYSVKKCWASQFGFIAIQYKRRYGQCLNTPMAVVIQEMVSCDVAGVIFTCDPLSGNGSKMSIAANYGLGESVVSAAVEPDTIVLVRNENDEVIIDSINPGQKSQKIVMTDEGTVSEDIPEDLRKESCLSTDDIIRLGNLAIKVEKYYRSKRDIEWGLKDSAIFLFQSRPVTSGTEETDFEIEHELDAALRIENDYFSVHNAAEVLPGALAHLSRDVFFKLVFVVWQGNNDSELQNGVKSRYFDLNWFTTYNHCMMSITDTLHQSKPGKRTNSERAVMISLFGKILDIEEIFEITHERFSEDHKPWWLSIRGMLKSLLFSGKHSKDSQKYYENYRMPLQKYLTAKDLFYGLSKHYSDIHKVCFVKLYKRAFTNLLVCTQGSMLWNMLILTTLSQDKEEIDSEVYTDFSKLITSKGYVESADVPSAIEKLAFDISKSIAPEKFKEMKIEEAVQWLKETPSLAGKTFSEFLLKHGHRCYREYDIYSITWGTDPRPLVQLLQNLVGNVSKGTNEKENKSILRQISELKTPLSLISKLKLLLSVPMSRKCVQQREAAKSLLVKVLDSYRNGYWELARRMVSEGRIPEEKILFFMTLDEIKDLLETRSPNVLAKAYHRLRLHPKMDKYQFPEIIRGIPRPKRKLFILDASCRPPHYAVLKCRTKLNKKGTTFIPIINETEDEHVAVDGDLLMKGIPVSPGVVKGFLRVALTVNEAADLKHGEILLAYGTDIGWTPYFPSLAGVATELGGLISHGAVVSREYGLPCVVGLHGATKKFRTGDYVLLDGGKGLIQRILPPTEA